MSVLLPHSGQGEPAITLTVSFDEAIAMVRDGRITDSKSVAALLWVKSFL